MAKAPTAGFLSSICVLIDDRAVYRAHAHPAGPPPTMRTSVSMKSVIFGDLGRQVVVFNC